jgi:ribonuclease III
MTALPHVMSDRPTLQQLQEQLQIFFTDQQLLQQVFVHRSYLNEHKSYTGDHNERLEFLGDAVLELIVTDHLYRSFPNPEGELTIWRSALVKGETLASVAQKLDFPDYLLLSRGEAKSGGSTKGYLLANSLEAFIGALYLDQGYAACEGFVHAHIIALLPEIFESGSFIDPKSRLQEYTQEHHAQTPQYVVVDEVGPDHAKTFTVEVRIGDQALATGTGMSKQAGQVAAARAALEQLLAE